MNKTITVLVVALVAIIGGVIYLTQNANNEVATETVSPSPTATATATVSPTATPTPTATAKPNEVIVRYTDSGYSPNSVEVSVGTKVTFLNESSVLMWTASAPHPTHTDLPSLDAKVGIGTGKSYSFTFTQKGTWKYHNHLKASHFGSVTVK